MTSLKLRDQAYRPRTKSEKPELWLRVGCKIGGGLLTSESILLRSHGDGFIILEDFAE